MTTPRARTFAFRTLRPIAGRLFALLGVALLAGCGGGGGGSSGGNAGGGSGGGGTLTGISVSPTSVSFTSNHDDSDPPPAQTVTITAHEPGTTYLALEGGGAAGIACSGGASCTFQVRPAEAPYNFVTPGTTTNGFTIIGCADAMCVSGAQKGRVTVTYTYTVTPGLALAPADPVPPVNGVEGVQTPPLVFTATHPSGTVEQLRVLTPTLGNPPFATVTGATAGPTPSGITLQVAFASNLRVGTYTGTLEVFSGASPRATRRAITYVVQSAYRVSGLSPFVVDAATPASALQQTVTIDSHGSGASFDWTAWKTEPWLELSPTSGNTASSNSLVVSLPPAAIERVPIGVHHATVTLRPPGWPTTISPAPLTFDVVLDMRLPLAAFALPKVVVAGSEGEVYIQGSGFTALPGTVSFGGTAATSVNRESDARIRATYPATLASGSHTIELGIVPNNAGLNRRHASLMVVTPAALPAAVFSSNNNTKSTAIFDDERRALYVADNWQIERYLFNGTWSADAPLPIAGLRDLLLVPGGHRLLALSAAWLEHVDPGTWSVVDQVPTPTFQTVLGNRTLGAGLDGEILIGKGDPGVTATNILRHVPATGFWAEEFLCCISGHIRSSGDGTLLYWNTGSTSAQRYDVRTRQTQVGGSAAGQRGLSVSRNGTTFLIDGTRVYDSGFSLLGQLSAPEPILSGVMTTDGRRAYGYTDGGYLYSFDLTAFNGSGGFVQVGGRISVADAGTDPVMTTSVDGLTVFIAGSSRVIVQPVP